MNVLSLFDGISCGQVSLERAGIKIEKYFASEIDKYAIKITQKNYPSTIQLGDITKVSYENGILYGEYDAYNIGKIDLILAGSPCQGFSLTGKQLNFNDPRSKLFFDFVRILKEVKPKYFLLENVRMKKEYQDIISKEVSVEPFLINSTLVSAQSRNRLYWTNIPNINQPEDKGIFLHTILENKVDTKYYLSDSHLKWWIKNREFQLKKKYSTENPNKAMCLTARMYASYNGTFITKKLTQIGYINKNQQAHRIYNLNKSCTLSALGGGWGAKTELYEIENKIRRLTPLECERLQTLPDNYTEGISDSHRYRCLGNGWTADVAAHILKTLKGHK